MFLSNNNNNNNKQKRLATGAVFSSVLLMSGVFAAPPPPAYTNDDFEEEEEEDDDNDTLNEGERDVVDELADEWTGDDIANDDDQQQQQEQEHLDTEQLPLEEQDSNSNIIRVKVDEQDTQQSILDPPDDKTPWIDEDNDKQQQPAAGSVNEEGEDTGFDDAGTLDLAEQEDTDDAEDDTPANLEDDGDDDGTKAAENETPEDSELTVEKPWDDSTSEEEEEEEAHDTTTGDDEKSAFDDNDDQAVDEVEEEQTVTMEIDDGNLTEQLPPYQTQQETSDVEDPSTALPPTVEDDSMIKLDDYQVDNTVEEINQSLEKALDSLQQPGSIADQNERVEFANANNFFPDENPQRYPSTIPPPIQPTKPEQEGFSVSMLFFIALSLFLLMKAPKIKRYLTPRSGDYKSTLPYHHAHGKTRD
ncbi:hypothetical protein O0I10_009887 [Lichtheimia ornata]|uniref:Uncharacterized protein n=1 Tax=Lichtheimia ornata TaxID=688661 RepID=A0AAD7UYJ5_9FUNG|nr:uncharacterized protein O0I10_009887 [Lichtheimia ornata]KAJ8654446.1 hypothetical protein O0I10_009887 [Lichtheimia ornata]